MSQHHSLHIHTLSLGMSQAYLIEASGGLALVDCGMPRQEGVILRLLGRLGRSDLKLIFLTHAHVDHAGSAAALKRLTGAPVAIHLLDAPALTAGKMPARSRRPLLRLIMPLAQGLLHADPVKPDLLLEDGDSLEPFGIPGRVVHTPGHTPGSACLVLENTDGFAGDLDSSSQELRQPVAFTGFIGDLASSSRKPHLQNSFAEDWEQLRQSYRRLRELQLERAYPGHGRSPVDGNILRGLLDSELDSQSA